MKGYQQYELIRARKLKKTCQYSTEDVEECDCPCMFVRAVKDISVPPLSLGEHREIDLPSQNGSSFGSNSQLEP
jgi:hypothetical protein